MPGWTASLWWFSRYRPAGDQDALEKASAASRARPRSLRIGVTERSWSVRRRSGSTGPRAPSLFLDQAQRVRPTGGTGCAVSDWKASKCRTEEHKPMIVTKCRHAHGAREKGLSFDLMAKIATMALPASST